MMMVFEYGARECFVNSSLFVVFFAVALGLLSRLDCC